MNFRAGNKRVETVAGLFTDLESFNNPLAIEKLASTTSILKTASTRMVVTFDKTPPDSAIQTSTSSVDNPQTYDWKGQKNLNSSQVGFLLKKFHKGCIICRTNMMHEVNVCPVIKDKLKVTVKAIHRQPRLNQSTHQNRLRPHGCCSHYF